MRSHHNIIVINVQNNTDSMFQNSKSGFRTLNFENSEIRTWQILIFPNTSSYDDDKTKCIKR